MGGLLAGDEMLGMLHLHEKEFQGLDGHFLTGKEEVKSLRWPIGYLTTSKWGSQYMGMQPLNREGLILTPASLKRSSPGFGHVWTSLSLQAQWLTCPTL